MRVGGSFGFQTPDVCEFVQRTGMTAVQVTFPIEHKNWRMETNSIERWKLVAHNLEVYVHAPLNFNPCDASRKGWHLHNLAECCRFAKTIRAIGVVAHPGSRKEDSFLTARNNLVEFFRNVIGKTWWDGKILLETDSGSKGDTKVGSPEFLQEVCEMVYSPQLRICVDTEHMYARGTDMWDADKRRELMGQLGSHVELIHLNAPDPQVQLGGFLDRHSIPLRDHQPHQSVTLIQDLVTQFPCILERNTAKVQEQDMADIRLAMETLR